MWPFFPRTCSDQVFVEFFGWFVSSTWELFEEPRDGYEPMVVTKRGQSIGFHVLTPQEDPGQPVHEKDVLRDFGLVLRRRWFKPQVVLAALLGETLDDRYELQISGCTLDLRECAATLHLEKDHQDNLK